eukprot:Em0007g936a
MAAQGEKLLAAAFSAMLGIDVKPSADIAPRSDAESGAPQKLTVYDLFRCTYVMQPYEAEGGRGASEVHVKTLTGVSYTIPVNGGTSVAQVKGAIASKANVPPQCQRLIHASKELQDHQTIESEEILHGSTLYLVITVPGGGGGFQLDPSLLDPTYNYNFTDKQDDGKVYMRGGFVYNRPYGWMRYAIKVLQVPEYGGDQWLGPNGIRAHTTGEEWPVSYHGTAMENVDKIISQGFKPGPRQLFGKGVYSSPSLDMVARLYSKEFQYEGKSYKVVLQNRVNPDQINGHLKVVPASDTGVGADYWVATKHDPKSSVYDVRPYGILIREV